MIQNVDEELARQFGSGERHGALVSEVSPGSPAEKGGLQQGDLIMAMNGRKVDNVSDLRNRIAETQPDTDVSLCVLRDGQEKTLSMRIGSQPKDLASGNRQRSRSGMGSGILDSMGLSLQDLSDDVARQFGYDKNQGVLIASVEPGSVAEAAGLESGQIVEEINRSRVRSIRDVPKASSTEMTRTSLLLERTGTCFRFNYEIGRASVGKECRSRWSPYH